MLETEEEEKNLRNMYLGDGYDSEEDVVDQVFFIGQKV